MRKTSQKDAILSAVYSMKIHPNADQIYSELKQDISKLSLGTVYRNLNKFAEQGKIHKIVLPNTSDRFDYRLDRHQHLLCHKCGCLFDADVKVSLDIKNCNYTIEDYTLIFYGICAECSAKN